MRYFRFSILSFFLFAGSCQSQPSSQAIGAKAFHDSLEVNNAAVVLDVRTHDEFESGYIDGAFNMNFGDPLFQSKINSLDKQKSYFVYCLSGGRSNAAAAYMRKNGFSKVYDLKGGILAWQGREFPLVTPLATVKADKISKEAYESMVLSDSLVLIDFFATWCAPCLQMEPMLNELTKTYAGKVTISRINIGENKQLAKLLGVEEVPIFKMFYKGREVWMKKGVVERKELVAAMELR